MDKAARVQAPSTPSASSSSPRHPPRHPPRRRNHDRELPDTHPDTPPQRRIIVTGFPPYTLPQELVEVFSKFGEVRVDAYGAWGAVLSFGAAGEARAALAARQPHVYGRFLSARPYSAHALQAARPPAPPARPPAPPATPKREFPMSKMKGLIIEPKHIDLTGDFHSQLDSILSAIRLTQEDVKALSSLYTDLEMALQQQWPGCKAVPFGSITTGLGIKTSDADCFINIPGQYRQPHGNYVNKAKRVLLQYPNTFAEILAIPRANTPIVKLFHTPTDTNCDLTFKTPLGAQNSRLIAFLLHYDPRLLPMAVIIKYWAKVHELSGTGKLTNYALTLMIIFYLQQPPQCILPSVAWLQQRAPARLEVDRWDTAFMSAPAQLPPTTNTSAIAELLGGFFEYYALFNFDEMVVCPYLATPVRKDVFRDTAELPDDFQRYKNNVLNNYVMPIRYQTSFCVQDPFEQCHNVASTVTSKLALDLKTYFKFAANAYEKEKLNACQDFLKIILLQRPKLIRGKAHPEYRVNLFPRIVNTIISFDWKSVVRDLVMEIFENMLKIKLGKVEEKVNPDTKKQKEKYMGSVEKAIWRRKLFNKMYNLNDMTFEEKQGRITEAVLKAETHLISIQFQLTLTYCHDPKSAVICIRLGAGDVDAFREFGKFFISVMQIWFTQLLKPYSMPNCKDTAAKIAESLDPGTNENGVNTDDDDDEEEVVLTPRTRPASEAPATNNTEHAMTNNNEETLTKKSVETLTKICKETLTLNSIENTEESLPTKDELLRKNADTLTTNTGTPTNNTESMIKNAETLTTNTGTPTNNTESMIKNAETLTTNTGTPTNNTESMIKNADTLTTNTGTPTNNTESMTKNAESLLTNVVINHEAASESASDVIVACASK